MRHLLTSVILFQLNVAFFAQQLENASFELWENVGTPNVEPLEWSSLKTADALASTAPTVIDRDNGRPGAGYCIKLEAKVVFGIPANGMATNGRVHADFNPENGYVYTIPGDPQWHTPFSFRPDSLVGWYKYAPASGDKGKVEVALHVADGKLPNMPAAHFIGSARANFTASTNNQWMRFSVPFYYASAAVPEYVLAVIACGDSTQSKNGTLLWVDDLELIYNTGATTSPNLEESSAYFLENYLMLNQLEYLSVAVFSLDGKLLARKIGGEVLWFPELKTGAYVVVVDEHLRFKVFKGE